jgi:plasmid maintenance system antidote protein VapI
MKTWRLGDILRQKMMEENLPMDDLAEKLGLALCSTWRFLTGNGNLRFDTVERLMDYYGLGVVELPRRKRAKGRKHGKSVQ